MSKKKVDSLFYDYEKIWRCFNPSKNTVEMSKILEIHFLKRYNHFTDQFGNIFIGDFTQKRPCLVAHIDSVHLKKSTKFNLKGYILSSNNGIGGDDKCGIIAILETLKNQKNVNAIFTVDEEIGGIGAGYIEADILKNVMFFIEIDRRGCEDVIFQSGYNTLASEEFKKDIIPLMKLFGLKENIGTFTDVNILTETAKKSAINLFAGYYEAHTPKEYVSLLHLWKAISFVKLLLENLKKEYPLDIASLYDKFENYYCIEEIIEEGYYLGMNQKQILLLKEAYYLGSSEKSYSEKI